MVMLAALVALSFLPQAPAVPQPPVSIEGAWTLNRDLSDVRPERPADKDGDRDTGRGSGNGRRGGRGGFGGGGGRGIGRGGARGAPMDPEAAARMRDALRDVMEPSDRLTIVQSGSIVLITGADGRTSRLSPDGKSIKDENTGVARKTRWDAGRLVSEITGLGRGKVTQTFAVDPETHQLRVTVQREGGLALTHVYENEKKGSDRDLTPLGDRHLTPLRDRHLNFS